MRMDGESKEEIVSSELFEKVRIKAETFYATTEAAYCPYLQGHVSLNRKGFEHIKFKEWGKPRGLSDQYQRLKLLHLIPLVLTKSHTVQGLWYTKEWERQKKHARWQKLLREVVYYEFVAVVEKVRVKIIIKKVEDNAPFFWTLIPFWKTNKSTGARILHDTDIMSDGNFSTDLN